jgi:ribosomal protein L11 methyltransferase
MSFNQLVITLAGRDPGPVEEGCVELGAMAVSLGDAADHPILEPAPGETPLWPEVTLTALFGPEVDIRAAAASLSASLGLASGQLHIEHVEDRAWEREWLKDFRPMRFGQRLWICPGGQAAPDPHATVIELDPGLAFGTGTHATTAMCLEWLDAVPPAGERVLDYGCGSGILALAALKLGASAAWAVDIDPQALLATRENALRNGLEGRLTVQPADGPLPGRFDVVLANILAGPLAELAPRLAELTAPGGRIVLAGLLDGQADPVAEAYAPWFDIGKFAAREGWTALTARRRAE